MHNSLTYFSTNHKVTTAIRICLVAVFFTLPEFVPTKHTDQ
jgi:hypothetical protein